MHDQVAAAAYNSALQTINELIKDARLMGCAPTADALVLATLTKVGSISSKYAEILHVPATLSRLYEHAERRMQHN